MEAVNFRDAEGRWRPIDTTLQARSGAIRNRAAEYSVELPPRLNAAAVRVSRGDNWVSFGLRGAAPSAAVTTGSEARYADVLPGVAVEYVAEPTRVKETLQLASAAATGTFVFDLDVGPGLTPRLRDSGAIALLGADGRQRMVISAPFMRDGAGEVSRDIETTLEPDGDAWALTLVASREWLDAPSRRFPVALDPTVETAPDRVCTIMKRQLTEGPLDLGSRCDVGQVGYVPSLDYWYTARTLAHWDLSEIPADAVVSDVTVVDPESSWDIDDEDFPVAFPLSRGFTSGLSWDTYDGVHAWASPGGDYDAGSPLTSGADIEALVKDWISGARDNDGMILIDDEVDGYEFLDTPDLTIEYTLPEEAPDPTPPAPALSATSTTSLADATSFLYDGPGAVQSGVEEGTIAPTRAAVLRGHVASPEGDALAGVRITVPGHPEFGATETLADGQFYMAVNGGAALAVRYELDGHLASERAVEVPWQDYVWVDDVVLTPLDVNATELEFDGESETVQVAHGSEVVDDDGERTTTLLFAPETAAELVLPNGDREPVEDATVRVTEFTVGDSGPEQMPGELPATTAYTYAAEFSLDEALAAGAETVEFSKPVAAYTDNFLEVPVGVNVPTGYYDRRAHAWRPLADGRIVKILSEAGGVAVLDVTGTGVASTTSELEEIGIDEAEQERLAELYDPGSEFSRLTMTHFTPIDGNYPFRMPSGAYGPDGELIDEQTDEDCSSAGSNIGCENQTLGESIDVAGTPFSLNYESDRTPASAAGRSLRMKLIGDTVHPDLEQIVVETRIAGRRFKESFAATPDLQYRFTWDGEDAFGRTVQGTQTARVRVGYQYDVVYATAVPYTFADNELASGGDSAFNSSWGAMPDPLGDRRLGGSVGGGEEGGGGGDGWVTMPVATRGPQTLWREYQHDLGTWDARAAGLGGWTLDDHHAYDPLSQTLHLGDGSTRSADSVNAVIENLDPEIRPFGAAEAQHGIEVGPDGTVYIADFYADQVFKRTPDGEIELLAGDPPDPSVAWYTGTFSGDGGPATEAGLDGPAELELLPDGSLLLVDQANNRIPPHRRRRHDHDGGRQWNHCLRGRRRPRHRRWPGLARRCRGRA